MPGTTLKKLNSGSTMDDEIVKGVTDSGGSTQGDTSVKSVSEVTVGQSIGATKDGATTENAIKATG